MPFKLRDLFVLLALMIPVAAFFLNPSADRHEAYSAAAVARMRDYAETHTDPNYGIAMEHFETNIRRVYENKLVYSTYRYVMPAGTPGYAGEAEMIFCIGAFGAIRCEQGSSARRRKR